MLVCTCKPTVAQIIDPSPLEEAVSELDVPERLPFTLVYGGTQVRNTAHLLKDGGFSHIALGSTPAKERGNIPPTGRAVLWTGVAQGDKDSPWAVNKSPWGNSLSKFEPRWTRRLRGYSESYGETASAPAADFIVLDIESERRGSSVEELRLAAGTAQELKALPPTQFAALYERDMLKLSASAVHFLKKRTTLATTRYSSYGDVPIARNWYGIPKKTWEEWRTNPKVTNFMGDEGPGIENPFAEELNVITPSAYYFFPTGQNLAYLLFQIEANKARSNKELVVFITPRFVGKATYGNPISEELAEATAIFPFFSGAGGLWLWETSKDRRKTNDTSVLPAYRGFFRGLKRLSTFYEFFRGDYLIHIPKTAHAAFSEKKPVWRAVVKNNEILVAAQNPYAKLGETTTIQLTYRNWTQEIRLQGDEILLEKYPL
jgi:hypothetical protein